eukprot:TRINITY_DN31483_c0_g1_i1.p1 TRINITY_DN31483_c0_g1~~TRINITY_DN31483_c0_g1_i1.p1  ORF type:complete len:362 (-),score=50.70 TRINITY_DN31483_c0_g1_i1:6-1091(-)
MSARRQDDQHESSGDSSRKRPAIPKIVNKRFQIKGKIGEGSYSVVHRALDRSSDSHVAVKFEWKHAEKTNKLLKEADLCKTFGVSDCVPRILWSGSEGEYNVMAMGILGPSLDSQFIACRRKFSLKTVLVLADGMLRCIEFVHSHGIIHRDIKPGNFVLGPDGHSDKLYLIDYGLAKHYIDPETGKHIELVKKSGMTGTARYTTVNLHNGCEPSRRDDLGSIGYLLVYFLKGKLPWQGVQGRDKKKRKKRIGRMKAKTSHHELCEGLPCELREYLEYCDKLEFDEAPDYDFLRSLIKRAAASEKIELDSVFDWVHSTGDRKRKATDDDDAYYTVYESYSYTTQTPSEKPRRKTKSRATRKT